MTQIAKLDDLITKVGTDDNYTEFEIRFGSFKKNRFISSVNNRDFYRVLRYFLSHEGQLFKYISHDVTQTTAQILPDQKLPNHPDIIEELTYEYRLGKKFQRTRESWIAGLDVINTPRVLQEKYSLGNADFPNYFFRFSAAREIPITTIVDPELNPTPIPAKVDPSSGRTKKRWSFAAIDQQSTGPLVHFRVDLTHVQGWYVKDERQININSYEVELEVIDQPITGAEIWRAVQFMLELMQNTPFPVTVNTLTNVITTYNDLFASDITNLQATMKRKNPKWRFDNTQRLYNPTNKPVSLHLPELLKGQSLSVTDKADGERKLMYVREDGAYLINPPNDVMRYLRLPQDDPTDRDYFIEPAQAQDLKNTLIDGEFVVTRNGSRTFLAFDLLMLRGKDLRTESFSNRLAQLQALKLPEKSISVKEFYTPQNGNLYRGVNQILDSIPNKPYANDGLILNIMAANYKQPGTIFKWKPVEQLTIDFELRKLDDFMFELNVLADRKQPFLGSERYPLNSPVVIITPSSIAGAPIENGQIVEMCWNSKKKAFEPLRVRYDRDAPNKLSTAIDVWHDIMNPITEDTIRGTNLVIMRRYHNKEKGQMLERYRNQKIVDFGSGRGGDVGKWDKGNNDVFAVEPNHEHVAELITRLESAGYEPSGQTGGNVIHFKKGSRKLFLMQDAAENKDIPALVKKTLGSTNVIAMFNVLTFFFRTEQLLDQLVDNLDRLLETGGVFMGMVMDGETVRRQLIKYADLKETLRGLEDDQYFNLETKGTVRERNIPRSALRNDKWKLVAKSKKLLDKTVKELDEPDVSELSGAGWKISCVKKFGTTVFGNEIKVHLEDSIVTEQLEYLVDFDELVKKLRDRGISLSATDFLDKIVLPEDQQRLSSMYRSFVFTKTRTQETLLPLSKTSKELKTLQGQIEASTAMQKHAEAEERRLKEELGEVDKQLRAGNVSKEDAIKLADNRKKLQAELAKAQTRKAKHQENLDSLEKKRQEASKRISTEVPIQVVKETAPELKEPTRKLVKKYLEVPTVDSEPEELEDWESAEPEELEELEEPDIEIQQVSAKIMIETELADDDFTSLANPIRHLKPEEKAPISIQGTEYVRIGALNACLLSALLRSVVKKYYGNLNTPSAQLDLAKLQKRYDSVSEHFMAFFEKAYFDGTDDLSYVRTEYPDWDLAKEVLEDCNSWPLLKLWGLLGRLFKTNIILVKTNGSNQPVIEKYKGGYGRTAVLYQHQGIIDTIASRDPDTQDLITEFQANYEL